MLKKFNLHSQQKRILALILLVSFIFCVLLIRLGVVQLINGTWLQSKAADQWTRDLPLKAERGKIYDITGSSLAVSYTTYNVSTGKPSGTASKQSYTYSATSTISGSKDEPAEVTVFYALVDGNGTQNLTLDNGAETPIPNVPLAPNTHVILRGDVQNVGFTTATITATADTDWQDSDKPIDF